MDNYLLFLAPCLAVLFFMLLAILTYCYYNSRKSDKRDLKEEVNEGHLTVAETKERSHSVMDDYFVVKHL